MVPEKYREFFTNLKDLAEKKEVPMARIDDAVRRILRVKAAMGLLAPGAPVKADRTLMETFGSAAHRAVARQAVGESLVLKNQNNRLPLSRTFKRMRVAGRNADDIGNQTGGWTITWQGHSGSPDLLARLSSWACQQPAGDTTKITYSRDGTGAEGADVGVVVVGETPYRGRLRRSGRTWRSRRKTCQAMRNVKQAGIPVVVVLLSGRPMIVAEALDPADAFVAAWLPGPRGPRGGGRALRRPSAGRQAARLMATVDGADPNQRRRRHVQSVVPVRLWSDAEVVEVGRVRRLHLARSPDRLSPTATGRRL